MMKHTQTTLKFALALCATLLLFALTLLIKPEQVQPAAVETGGGMALQPPAFLKSAHAQDAAQVDFDFLLEEAGVTAYTKLNQELDLTNLESRFKTIAQQTDQFISGIVIAPGYEKFPEFGESAEVQVFLHRDGWIVGYLTRYQTTSALFDWVSYEEKRLKDSTLIENVVRMLALDSGVSDFNVAYYDFRYPEATNLMLAAERVDGNKQSESFEVNVPRQLTVYESSWSNGQFDVAHGLNTDYPGSCALNDEMLVSFNPGRSKWGVVSAEIPKAKFRPDTSNKLSISGNGARSYLGIAIVYREGAK